MDFARRQLEKYGWSDGKGLGKHEDGISEALRPKLKRSVAGIGYDAASEFNEHWWKTLYDKAATNIRVEEKNGKTKKIKTIDQDEFQITNNMWHLTKKKSKNSEQATKDKYQDYFVKKAILTNNGIETERAVKRKSSTKECIYSMTDEQLLAAADACKVKDKNGKRKKVTTIDEDSFKITNDTLNLTKKNSKDHQDNFVESDDDVEMDRAKDADKRTQSMKEYNMTDEQLFAACEGRTAHKGARHGLKALGKLARIEEQERILLASPKYEAYSHSKRNKTPREKSIEIQEEIVETTDLCNNSEEKIVKIKKKKRHCSTKVNQDLETEALAKSPDSLEIDKLESNGHEVKEDDRVKRKKSKQNKLEQSNVENEEGIKGTTKEVNLSNVIKTQKLRNGKCKESNYEQKRSSSVEVCVEVKKRKHKVVNTEDSVVAR